MRNLLYRLLQILVLVAVVIGVVAGVARADEDDFVHFKKRTAGSLSCTSSNDSALYSQATQNATYTFGFTTWYAQKFTVAAATRVTALTINLRDVTTTDSCTVTISLYTDSSNKPGTQIGTSTSTLAETSISDVAQVDYEMVLSEPVDVAAGDYWIVVRSNHASETGSTRLGYNNAATGKYVTASTDSGSTWAAATIDKEIKFTLSGCQ